MDSNQQIWDKMLTLLQQKLGDITFNEYFKDSKTVYKEEGNYYYIIVPNALIKFRIEQFAMPYINELVPYVSDKKIGFRFILQSEIKEEENKLTSIEDVRPIGRNLSTLYRFNNFEVGESNRYAFVTAMKVAENGVKICNPLYIF